MSPTYFPPKPLIAMGLTSDVKRLVTPPLTVFRCNKCSLNLTDISSDFKDTNITRVTNQVIFFNPKKIRVDKFSVFI